MPETIVRPLPVPSDIAIRSALLALANLGAELQTYSEDTRTIVANMPKWFGMKKATVLVRVQDYGDNCRMEIELPDSSKSDELFNQISLYLVDGHRAASDMTMRWVENQEQNLAYSAGQQVAKAIKRLKPGTKEALPATEQATAASAETETEPIDDAETALIGPIDEDREPDFIIAEPESQQVRLHVDPTVFEDRSSYLETCASCQAVVLRGSQFCSNCGRPVTLKAVSKEVNEGGRNMARSSLIFGGLAIAFQVVALYFLVVDPLLSRGTEAGVDGPALPAANILLAIVLGVVPSFLLGNEARRMAKTTSIYLQFRFNKDQAGSSLAQWGRNLGWAAIYISVGWVVYLAARNFL